MTFLSLAKFRPTKLSYIAAPLLYGALAVLLTWPMARHLGTHLLGQSDDTPLHYWNCWWVQHALLEGHSPYFTRYLFYPRGVSLLTHNIAWGNALGFILLEPLLGGIAAYNLTLILSLALCGWAAFALLRHLTHHLSAALLGGIIYQAWPYRLSQLGHPNLLSTFWIPIFILALLRTLEHRQRRDALFVGLAFALVGYTRWQLLIPATIMGSFLFAAWFWANRPSKAEGFRQPFKQAWQRLALGAAVALLLLLPPLVLLARELRGDLGLQELFRQDEARSQADLMAYLTPQASHPLFGSWSRALYERYYADRQGGHYPAYLGLATFVLALIGLIRRPRQGWPWAALILFFGLLALGPLLRINGVAYPRVPTLYGLLAPLEVLRILREPGRYVLFLALPFAALAALAIASLSIPRPALCWVALAALIVAEYLPIPIPLRYIKAPPQPYVNVAASPSTGAVLDLPIDPYKAKVYMFDQTVHGRPLIQGHLSRLPA
ncbi:MAG: hypothetical protein H5T69_13400, partial [Chloroflexi bacterium]|nr:hypothetical protein [Chloroflexota bacterium]